MKQIIYIFFILILNNASAQLDIVLQTGHNGTINQLEFHKTKNILLSSDTYRVVIWDLQQRKQFTSIDFSAPLLTSGFINDTELYVVTNNSIKIWDFIKLTLTQTITTEKEIKSVQYYDNTLYYLTDKIHTYNFENNKKSTIKTYPLEIKNIKLSNHGKVLGISTNNTYLIFDIKLDTIVSSIDIENPLTSFISDELKTISIAISPSSIHTYSYENDEIIKLNVISNNRSWNTYSSIYLTNNWGISGDHKDIITVYDLKKGKILSHSKNHSTSISNISANSDLTVLAISGENGIINLYDNSLNLLHTFKSISPVPTCAQILNNSSELIIGYNNGEIKKWNINTHEVSVIPNIKTNKQSRNKHIEIRSLNKNSSILKQYWKSTITNKLKYEYFTIIFSPDYDYYSLEKIDNYAASDYSKPITLSNNNLVKLKKNETITFISTFKINNNYLIGSSNGFLYLIDSTGQETLKLVSPSENSFFYTTPNNYYFASKNALKHIGARYNSQLIGFEQIDLIYNRPDKVIPLISPSFSDEYINLLSKAYKKRLKKLNITSVDLENILNLPTFFSSLKDLPINTNNQVISININASSKKSNLKALHILINDVPIYGKAGLSLQNSTNYESTLNIELSRGKNNIQIFIENELGTKSLREKASINCNYSHQPTLHILSIGSNTFNDDNYNLKYAAKDANDITSLFSNTKEFKEIKSSSITGDNVTIANINKSINELKSANINDVVIIFFAGHGVLDQNLDYYLSTYNMNFDNPKENGLNFDLFENKLSLLKCRHKLLLIDACHSGELDKDEIEKIEKENTEENEDLLVFRSGQSAIGLIGGKSAFELSKNIFVDLRSNSGIITISSAGAAEYALEGEKWKNGAFTYCLLKGIIDKEADFNNDKKINTNELQKYLFIEVPKLTKGKQTPTSRVELMEQNFIVW